MFRVPSGFVDKTPWPEYRAVVDALHADFEAVTTRVMAVVLKSEDPLADIRAALSGRD